MKELLEKMQDTYETFKANATLQLEKQNKAAGTRARKDSLILENWLRNSVKHLWKQVKSSSLSE